MGHADLVAGPFAGDPRVELKKLADHDAIAQLGVLIIPFQTSSDKAWPVFQSGVIDTAKLVRAENVVNPLSLDRCRASAENCIVTMQDFTARRIDQSGSEKETLRPHVIAHHYAGLKHQDAQRGVFKGETYVFYLPERNIFYLGGYISTPKSDEILGPFAGDPRVVLKKLAEASNVN